VGNRLVELVAEFAALNRRRVNGHPSLTVLELERWAELRDLLAYEFGHKPPLRAGRDRALRVPTHLKVSYGDAGSATTENLSEGGLFVKTGEPLAPGTPLRLAIDAGGGEPPIELDAVVVWRRELGNRDGPAGFGVEFRNLEADEFAALARLLERSLQHLGQA
jgi:uncharacterized protein (TIGR02266 family)